MNESSEETEHSHTRPKNFFFPPFRERKSKKSVSIFQKSLELRGLVWCSVCCFLADTTMNDDGDCLGCLLTFLFLMCLDLILMGFTGRQLWWLRLVRLSDNQAQKGLFTCRQAFHMAIFVLVGLRAMDFGFFSLAHFLIGKVDSETTRVLYDFISVFGIACALWYCHAYSILLLFWVSFLQKMGSKKLSFKPILYDANIYTRISMSITLFLMVGFVVFFIFAEIYQARVLYWSVAGTLVSVIMGLEALAFLITGVLLRWYSKETSLSMKGLQIVLSASTISFLFILRMLYILIDNYWIRMKWWSAFFCFYIFLEDLPIVMMLYFQSSFPKRTPQSWPGYSFEQESLLPDCSIVEQSTSWEELTDEKTTQEETDPETNPFPFHYPSD